MKANKIINIVLFSLIGAILVSSIVLFFIDKDLLLNIFNYIKDFVNQPLPIIGVTVGAVLIFVWKIVISLNYGKKQIAAYDKKLAEIEQAHYEYTKTAEQEKALIRGENEVLKKHLIELCALSTNKKIKDFGKELDNGETTNPQTKEE